MRFIDLQEAFEIELNVLDDGFNKPKSMDTEWWLNKGLEKFWKTRYSGMNFKSTGFEQDQKRIDDLRTLVITQNIIPDKVTDKEYHVTIPHDYAIFLGDTSGICPSDDYYDPCWELDESGDYVVKYTDTIESSVETILSSPRT